jgi:hypothetical protein
VVLLGPVSVFAVDNISDKSEIGLGSVDDRRKRGFFFMGCSSSIKNLRIFFTDGCCCGCCLIFGNERVLLNEQGVVFAFV